MNDSAEDQARIDAHPRLGAARLVALLLAVSVLVFAVCGALWGWLRPTYTLIVADDGQVGVADAGVASQEFAAFCGYLIIVAAAAVLCMGVSLRVIGQRWLGLATTIVLLTTTILGVVMFDAIVGVVENLRWRVPQVDSLRPGDAFEVAVEVPTLHGFIVAGLVAALAGWVRTIWHTYTPD